METKWISIIIPVYNAQDTIEKAANMELGMLQENI